MTPHLPSAANRRDFLFRAGGGLGAIALNWLAARDAIAAPVVNAPGSPNPLAPKTSRVGKRPVDVPKGVTVTVNQRKVHVGAGEATPVSLVLERNVPRPSVQRFNPVVDTLQEALQPAETYRVFAY